MASLRGQAVRAINAFIEEAMPMSRKSSSYYGIACEMSREEYEEIIKRFQKESMVYKAFRISADRTHLSFIGVSMTGLQTGEMVHINDILRKTAARYGVDPASRPEAGELVLEVDKLQ
jgi:hypothetical protein